MTRADWFWLVFAGGCAIAGGIWMAGAFLGLWSM